ncbi:MAG: M20 family metallopeptidase [Clostridia bacterium]|nr:M20 family metallopeptidase [Clostridia bacterium]
MRISKAVEAQFAQICADRSALHRIPEESGQERKTQRYVLDALAALEPDELAPCADTGVRAVFRGDGSGRCVAFRADMDALCIAEGTGRPDASEHPGHMHACGHDGHMACLLALARLVAGRRDALRDHVVLLFQPSEEAVGGARRMIEAGAMDNPKVDAIYALHMMPDLPLGAIGTCVGALMASTAEVDITIHGRAAHGAMPHLGADAVAAAAHLYTLLQTTVARRVNPFERALITVGRLRAGTRRNVIADHALLECTVRSFSDEVRDQLLAYIQDDMRGVEAALGVRCQMRELFGYPCVFNDEGEVRRLAKAAGDSILQVTPKMAAEDFSYFQHVAPGAYCFCGCMDDAHNAPLHNEKFDFDERALLYGVQLFHNMIASHD